MLCEDVSEWMNTRTTTVINELTPTLNYFNGTCGVSWTTGDLPNSVSRWEEMWRWEDEYMLH